ncbi:unnamed protein product [Cochlearia groenlandica]
MFNFMKRNFLKSFIVSLTLTIIIFISPSSSSSSNQETRRSSITTQKKETYTFLDHSSPNQLVYVKKTTPFISNRRRQRDQHRLRRYNNHHYYHYYRHTILRRDLQFSHRHDDNFKTTMMTKKKSYSNGFNRPVRPVDIFSVMLPKGFVPPSGSSPCHNQNPNSVNTLYCDLSTQP